MTYEEHEPVFKKDMALQIKIGARTEWATSPKTTEKIKAYFDITDWEPQEVDLKNVREKFREKFSKEKGRAIVVKARRLTKEERDSLETGKLNFDNLG